MEGSHSHPAFPCADREQPATTVDIDEPDRPSPQKRPTAHGWILAIIAAAPLLLWISFVPDMGRLPSNDYYWITGSLVSGEQNLENLADWLTIRSNEHIVTLPAIVYFANITLSHGDNRVLSAFTLLQSVLLSLLLVRLFRWQIERPSTFDYIVAATVGGFVFTPAAAHCVVLGFAGTIWIFATTLCVASISGLVWSSRIRPGQFPWPAIVPALLGTLTNTTALPLWPILVVGAVLLGLDRRQTLMILAIGIVVVSAVAVGWERMPFHPASNISNPVLILRYAAALLGGMFVTKPNIAAIIGTAGLVAGCGLGVAAVFRRSSSTRPSVAAWSMLLMWAVSNAVIVAVGRSNFGLEQAMASRYVTISTLFWVGVLGLVVEATVRQGRQFRNVIVVLMSALFAASWIRGWPLLQANLELAAMQPIAEEALLLDVDDVSAYRILSPAPEQVPHFSWYLRAIGHVPFDSTSKPEFGSEVGIPIKPQTGVLRGEVIRMTIVDDRFVRFEGWADPSVPVDLVGVDRQRKTRGRMVTGLPRLLFGDRWPEPNLGWAGYVQRAATDDVIRIVSPSADGAPLGHELSVPGRE